MQCRGTGRKWAGGTVPTAAICPVCHRGWRSLGLARSPWHRGRYSGTVPAHAMRTN